MNREIKRRRVPTITQLSRDDIESIWRQALPRGPYPDLNECAGLASYVNDLLRDLCANYQDLRHIDQAIAALRQATQLEPLQAKSLLILHRALIFGGIDARGPVWAGVAAILWHIARYELQDLGRVARSPHPNSPATKFSAFCLQRAGFRSVTVRAVADQLSRRVWAE